MEPTVCGTRGLDRRTHIDRINDWPGSDASGEGIFCRAPDAEPPAEAEPIADTTDDAPLVLDGGVPEIIPESGTDE